MLDTYSIKRRFTLFDEKSYSRLIKVLLSMTTYSLDEGVKRSVTDRYLDNRDGLLMKNSIVLKRRESEKENYLKISRLHYDKQYFYMDRIREKDRILEIKPRDKLSEHYFFLSNALGSMFSNALQFDTDKLFGNMRVFLITRSEEETRIMHGYGGLKMSLRYEKLNINNKVTRRKNKTQIVQFDLLSKDDTLPLFDEFIEKLNKKFKELFLIKENKCELSLRMTAPLPSKEEARKKQAEIARMKNLGLGEIKE